MGGLEPVAAAAETVEALRRSEERLRAVIEASPVAILEVDLDTNVVGWNPAAERIYGWRADEVLGRPVPFVPPTHRREFDQLLAKIRKGESYTGFETVRRRRDGSLVDVEISAAPVRDRNGRVISHMVVFSDITERKRQERELQTLNAHLAERLADLAESRRRIYEAADTERKRLERNLHDGAQQRLVAVSLTLRLAQRRARTDPDAAAALLDEAAGDLAAALDELRDLARGIHPAILTERGLAVALDGIAKRCPVVVELLELPAGRLPEPIEAVVYFLVSEALTNVARYADASVASVSVAQRDGHVVVEVRDDGVGGASVEGGTGLSGLRDRVEALHGTLELESPAEAGTLVRASLPLGP